MTELLFRALMFGSILALLIYALIEWVQKRHADRLLRRGFKELFK